MPFATAPALDADDIVTPAQDAELDGFANPPFEAAIHILLPIILAEVGLLLWEDEGIDTTIQMGILSSMLVSLVWMLGLGKLTREAVGLRVTMMIGHMGRYFEIRRAEEPLRQGQYISKQSSRVMRLPRSQDKNSPSAHLQAGAHRRHSTSLGKADGLRGGGTQLVEQADVWNGDLSQETGMMHHTN